MKRRLTIALFAAMLGAAAATAWVWRARTIIDPADPQQVARGGELYAAHCAQCHGARLQGEPDWQVRKPTGELPAPPHDVSGHTWHHTDEQLFAMTKYGMSRFAPADYKSAMPSFVGKLSDSDIRAVIAFIKASWPEEVRRRQQQLNRH
jgi:mono/diheme cytochrome c family protein